MLLNNLLILNSYFIIYMKFLHFFSSVNLKKNFEIKINGKNYIN